MILIESQQKLEEMADNQEVNSVNLIMHKPFYRRTAYLWAAVVEISNGDMLQAFDFDTADEAVDNVYKKYVAFMTVG